jgi:hypothetical protein
MTTNNEQLISLWAERAAEQSDARFACFFV